ncbi:hypothetical protein ACN4EE_07340 [Geminocystis sp. CENA526]|uniref:hypothetical protein n=1 Tax=Geminocystis sp. CENA526 TaxID=1355871 RepID=UPI003D6FB44D
MEQSRDIIINDILLVIELVKTQIIWKHQKAEIHLKKRIARKHLPPNCTIDGYEFIILSVINKSDAQLYLYQYNNSIYPTIVAMYKDYLWLVMFNMEGIMETAFPPDNPTSCLSQLSFKYLGVLKELKS